MSTYMDPSANVSGQSTKFKLTGLAEHVGSSGTSGHYTAHTLRDDNWYKFDDEYFNRVS